MTAADQTDWMYGTPVTGVSEDKANVTVTLNHALANINLTLAKGSYVGTGNVTAISVKSDGIAPKGTFNAAQETPAYSAFQDGGTAIERAVTTTLGGTATDIMVVPTGQSAAITFNVTVDGTVYTATSAAVQLEMGSSYKYALTLNSTMMSVSKVSVTPWNNVNKGELTMEKYNPWKNIANGVYAVSADGKPVVVSSADASCIAVALITDIQKIMIAKNNAKDVYGNTTFYWGYNLYGKDVAGIENAEFSSLATGNGKENTTAILASYNEYGVEMDNRDMCKILRDFNAGTNVQSNEGFADWYVPAINELREIYSNMNDINGALQIIGGENFTKYNNYWSSSEYSENNGWYDAFMSYGQLAYMSKNNGSYRVRFVRDI